MVSRFRSLHRFLFSQSFYPLVLSSLLALGAYLGRVVYTQRAWELRMLVWNLFLAWLPYCFSLAAVIWQRRFPRQAWAMIIPGAFWLAFFPNAPYIVTDFYHLQARPSVPFWFDIGMIALFALTGCFLAIASLRSMQVLVERYLGRWMSWIFVGVTLSLAGLGIYLGRFGRFNSWDLVVQPHRVIKGIALRLIDPLDNLGFIGFTLMFTAILLVFYLMFVSQSSQPQKD